MFCTTTPSDLTPVSCQKKGKRGEYTKIFETVFLDNTNVNKFTVSPQTPSFI